MHEPTTTQTEKAKQENYYELLGVRQNATSKEIRKAYLQKAIQYHPDKNQALKAQEIFKKINNAYHTLSDDKEREEYDKTLQNNQQANLGQSSSTATPTAHATTTTQQFPESKEQSEQKPEHDTGTFNTQPTTPYPDSLTTSINNTISSTFISVEEQNCIDFVNNIGKILLNFIEVNNTYDYYQEVGLVLIKYIGEILGKEIYQDINEKASHHQQDHTHYNGMPKLKMAAAISINPFNKYVRILGTILYKSSALEEFIEKFQKYEDFSMLRKPKDSAQASAQTTNTTQTTPIPPSKPN